MGITVLIGAALMVPSAAAGVQAPLLDDGPGAVPGQYLVVYRHGKRPQQRIAAAGATVRQRFDGPLSGYSAQLSQSQLGAVRSDPDVAYVQANRRYREVGTTQHPATWGLDRIDQRSRSTNDRYYYSNTGAGVDAYVVDTGLMSDHPDFTGRVGDGTNTVDSGSTADCEGHGTHVSGTIGGTVYGVAKGVTLHPVRVLDCDGSGSSESVVAGLEWIAAQHGSGPAVANLSLGGDSPGADQALEDAVTALIADGVTVVIAAGNSGDPACSYSPGRVRAAITVGATTSRDNRSSFSNYGSCVDLYAPGSGITSDYIGHTSGGDYRIAVESGTSMATPHVAGAAALYLQRHPTATPAQVSTALTAAATKGAVHNVSATWPRLLLFAPQKATPPAATTHPQRILPGTALLRGSTICSPSGRYCLTQRASDGHLVLYRVSPRATIWTDRVAGAWTKLTTAGNLASYNAYGKSVWSTATGGVGSCELRVRDRGYLALVVTSSGKAVWHSNAPVE